MAAAHFGSTWSGYRPVFKHNMPNLGSEVQCDHGIITKISPSRNFAQGQCQNYDTNIAVT